MFSYVHFLRKLTMWMFHVFVLWNVTVENFIFVITIFLFIYSFFVSCADNPCSYSCQTCWICHSGSQCKVQFCALIENFCLWMIGCNTLDMAVMIGRQTNWNKLCWTQRKCVRQVATFSYCSSRAFVFIWVLWELPLNWFRRNLSHT